MFTITLHHDTLFITADKFHSNKLSQSTTHLSRVKPLSPQQWENHVTLTSTCLNFFKSYWLPSFPPSPRQLKRQVEAKRRLMQVMEQLGSASGHPIQFFGCRDRLSSGNWLTAVSASWKKYDTSVLAVRLRHSSVRNAMKMTLDSILYELTVLFERCILETERMETWGNSLRFWNRKCIEMGKKIVSSSILLLLRQEIFLCRDILTGQHTMLIKRENFGPFLSWILRWENFLTQDILDKFYCICL
jgi:hypothetical protein